MPAETVTAATRTPDWTLRAAVLSVFDLDWIVHVAELDAAAEDQLLAFLDTYCERVVDGNGTPWWQLRDRERSRVLRETPLESLRSALRTVAGRSDDPVQAALVRYVDGTPAALDELDAAGLRAQLQLGQWISADGETADEVASGIRTRLDWVTVTEPLRRLLARGFYGRRELLQELHSFIEGPFVGSPFLVEGVGGSGKSSLIAKLMVDTIAPKSLFVYISFDRGWLLEGGPDAIFDEILRQVGAQWAEYRPQTDDLRGRAQNERDLGVDVASRSSEASGGFSSALLRRFSRIIRPSHRVVVVLDTLEELARRDEALAQEIYRFLAMLTTVVTSVAVIGVGRALPWTAEDAAQVRRLTGLGEADALKLMRKLTTGQDVPEDSLREVITLVGGNPLSLHLAADVLNRTSDDPAMLIAVGEGNIQGQLYARLLEHISDPRVRAIAHPGLVVRRITPGIIRSVLARPCGIAPLSRREAARVFEALRAEATLCEPSPDDDGALVHRQDVRAIMLPAITRDRPAITRAIHEAAVEYYRSAPGSRSTYDAATAFEVTRREELYHRLMLGQDREELDAHWWQPAATDLSTVMDEFPASSRVYLTTKATGLRLDVTARKDADDYAWQQVVRRSAMRHMEAGQVPEALDLIRERRGPDGRPLLPDLEIEALDRLGRLSEALLLVIGEQRRAISDGDVARIRELIIAEARVLERMRSWSAAWNRLSSLAEVDTERRAGQPPDAQVDDDVRIRELVVLTSMLRVARRSRRLGARLRRLVQGILPLWPFALATRGPRSARIPRESIAEVKEQTVALAESTSERVLTANASLLRDLAAEIGPSSEQILQIADETLTTGRRVEADISGSALTLAVSLPGQPPGLTDLLRAAIQGPQRLLRSLFYRRSTRSYQRTSDEASGYTDTTEPRAASVHGIQLSVGTLALLLPYVLAIGAIVWGHGLPGDLSGFYFTSLRALLQCGMTAIGVLVITYGGYESVDRLWSVMTGVCAIGFALLPPPNPSLSGSSDYYASNVSIATVGHLLSECLMLWAAAFLVAGFVKTGPRPPGLSGWRRVTYLLGFIPRSASQAPRAARAVYRTFGLVLVACALLVEVTTLAGWNNTVRWHLVYILECIALTSFGIAWLVKAWEGFRSQRPDDDVTVPQPSR